MRECCQDCPNLCELDFSNNGISKISPGSLKALAGSKVRIISLFRDPIEGEVEQSLLELVKECKLLGGCINFSPQNENRPSHGTQQSKFEDFSSPNFQYKMWPMILESPEALFRSCGRKTTLRRYQVTKRDAMFEILRGRLAFDMQSWWPNNRGRQKKDE